MLLVLLVTGVVAALPLQTGVWLAVGRFEWIRWIATAGVVAEALWITTGRPRPWSINTQVPQSWGHDHGPWKAALRYGFRLGVGPATILNSWSWWVGTAFSARSFTHGLAFTAMFVTTRSVLTIQVPGDPVDGLVLSQRMAAFRSTESLGRYVGLVMTTVLTALWWV
jgi:hypothetical protein